MPAAPALLDSLPGPWVEQPSGLPPGGPRLWWVGPQGVVIGGPPARVAEERAGLARLVGHPARPQLLATSAEAIALPPLQDAPDDPAAIVASWPRGEPWTATLSGADALALFPGRTDAARALDRLGLKRRAIDRWLQAPQALASHRGPSLGGVHGGWLRRCADGVVALRWAQATLDGLSATDLASTALHLAMSGETEALEDLRESHREGLPAIEADRAFDLALLRRALEEWVLGTEAAAEHASAAFERLSAVERHDQVDVRLEGAPDWLDPSAWVPDQGPVSAARARWLLQNIDGLEVGEHTLRVVPTPPLRAGRRPPPREDRLLRRRRLFQRWDQGVQTDDEGLFSATPEALALRITSAFSGVVMDGTAGVGSLAIALARNPAVRQVLAVDSHAGRLDMARHNAALYGVASRIRFLHQDVASALRAQACDALVLDPPWGGRDYDRARLGIDDLGLDLRAALALAPARVLLKLPRSFAVSTLSVGGPWRWAAQIDDRGLLKFLTAERG